MNFFNRKTQEEIKHEIYEKNSKRIQTIQNRIMKIYIDEFSNYTELFANAIEHTYRDFMYGGRLFLARSYYRELIFHGDIIVVSNKINILKGKLVLFTFPSIEKNNPSIEMFAGKIISCDENGMMTLTNNDETLDDCVTVSTKKIEGEIIDIISMADERWSKYIYAMIDEPYKIVKGLSEKELDDIEQFSNCGRTQENKDLRRKVFTERINLAKEKLKELESDM